ncbi:MAG TPA: ATP-binding protein [Verrucomicrobiae bacterium]|nr:ATP-binding protein [Verrucomicrobiae bacterium]
MVSKYNVKVQYAAWMATVTLATVVVMTAAHLWRELDEQQKVIQRRGEIAVQTLAKFVSSAVASNDISTMARAVESINPDKEILFVRILDGDGHEIFPKYRQGKPESLVIVRAPVEDGLKSVGTVELGMGQASASQAVMHAVFTDLIIGAMAVIAAVGISFLASAPVRDSLRELLGFVKRVDAGESRGEQLKSDLAEVNDVGKLLNDLVKRVEEAQLKLVRAQKQLKATQKEMDEYTYVISHDLKEPLRGIEAFSKFLVDDYRDKLDEEGRHRVDVIRKAALRMQRLINDLLKFSRLGHQRNPFAPVGLNAMLIHVRVNLQYALDAKKVDLRVDKLPTVMCDATAMTEVFHNLISNAIKYNENPRPVVEIGCEEKSGPPTGPAEYVVHVRDNGMGIKPEYFEKIFQIFQRLQRDDEGTGIGLTIVKRVIEWHGGCVWVESEFGKGTTFYFTLPKRELKETATATAAEATRTTTNGRPELAPTV